MSKKKDVARFTIRFNQENPRHNKAIQILNKNGKGMASLIADSLCMYVHYGADFTSDLVKTSKQEIPLNQEDIEYNSPTAKPADISKKNLPNTLNSALDSFF